MWNSRRLGGESGAVNRPVARGAAAVGGLAGFLVAAEDGANRANDAAPRQEEPQPCSSATAAALQAAEESAMAAANAARFEAYRRGEGVRAVEAAAARAAKKAREAAAALPVRAPALQGFSELELARRSSVNSSAANFAAPAKDAHVSGPTAASSAPKDAGKGLASMLGVEEDESCAGGRSVPSRNKASQKRTYSQVYSALDEMSRPALKEAKIEPSKASRQDGKPQTDDGKPKMKKVFVLGANKGAERAERDRKAAEEKERHAARQREQEEKETKIKREMASKRVDPATVMLSRRANHVVACTLVKSQFAGGALVPGYHEATCHVYKRMHWKQFDPKTKDWIFEYRHYGVTIHTSVDPFDPIDPRFEVWGMDPSVYKCEMMAQSMEWWGEKACIGEKTCNNNDRDWDSRSACMCRRCTIAWHPRVYDKLSYQTFIGDLVPIPTVPRVRPEGKSGQFSGAWVVSPLDKLAETKGASSVASATGGNAETTLASISAATTTSRQSASASSVSLTAVDRPGEIRKLMTRQIETLVSRAVRDRDSTLTKRKCREQLGALFGEVRMEDFKTHVNDEIGRLVDRFTHEMSSDELDAFASRCRPVTAEEVHAIDQPLRTEAPVQAPECSTDTKGLARRTRVAEEATAREGQTQEEDDGLDDLDLDALEACAVAEGVGDEQAAAAETTARSQVMDATVTGGRLRRQNAVCNSTEEGPGRCSTAIVIVDSDSDEPSDQPFEPSNSTRLNASRTTPATASRGSIFGNERLGKDRKGQTMHERLELVYEA